MNFRDFIEATDDTWSRLRDYHKKEKEREEKLKAKWNVSEGDVISVPASNIWIMHWSVNPYKSLAWLRKNPIPGIIEGRLGDEQEEQFQSYIRLVDIVPPEEPVNPNYPKVFIDDGTNRAIVMREKGQESIPVKIIHFGR